MSDLLERADPARGLETEMGRLRSKVDDRIGSTPIATPTPLAGRNVWRAAAAAFAVVAALAVVLAVIRPDPSNVFAPDVQSLGDLPGIEDVVQLASGGVQTMAADGDTIWVMTALAHQLQRISAASGRIAESYTIDSYVEGVIVGGGYVWLLSYDDGGEVLRFDPAAGVVDMAIPIGSMPSHAARWYGGSLWVSNDQSELHQISAAGEIVSTRAGELKGEGFGYLWVNDPITGLTSSLFENGTLGEYVIPTETGLVTSSGWGVRTVIEAGSYLWLMDGNYPFGTNLSRFDFVTGELSSVDGLTFGLISITEFDGALWLVSHTDHLLMRLDPDSGAVKRYPMPGKAGGLVVADGSLWVSLYQPGALIRVDPNAGLLEPGLLEAAPIVFDDWNLYPHRLLCTGNANSGGPTILLEPTDWVEYGSWSVVQAQLSNLGYLVCANGYLDGEATSAERAADMKTALISSGIDGPFVLVASGDGVHSTRLFAADREDIAGIVLVDPMPIGFGAFLDDQLDIEGPNSGHPAWLDLSPTVSDALGDFGDRPLAVIGGDPQSVYLSQRFIDGAGSEVAEALNSYWQDGLAFYAGLSSDARTKVAVGAGLDMVIWDRPDLVVQEIMSIVDR